MLPTTRYVVCFLLLVLVIAVVGIDHVESTASECRGPGSGDWGVKRGPGGVVLSYAGSTLERVHMSLKSKIIRKSTQRKIATRRNTLDNSSGEEDSTSLQVYEATSPAAKSNVVQNPNIFKVTGPINQNVGNRVPFTSESQKPCVACVLDCMSNFPTQGQVFASCGQRFYYYGCDKVNVCFNSQNTKPEVVQIGIGLCIRKNACVLKRRTELGLPLSATPVQVLDKVVKIVSSPSRSNPSAQQMQR